MSKPVAETLRDEDERLDEGAADVAAPVDPAPSWLIDFRRSGHGKGFYQSLGDHALMFADRGGDHLMVSFDNLSSARDESIAREPWGYGFVAKNGWSQLGVMAYAPDWFRSDSLFAALEDLAASGFFRRFRSVTMTGTSMGGYAACAFASLVPGCNVVAFSPQSTLKKDLVPWETRFSSGRKADWRGPYADAAVESGAAKRVFLVYDPQFEPDVKHVERFKLDNAIRLRARYSGHKSALFLRRAGLLSTIVRETVEERLTAPRFYSLYRQGRRLPWFVNALAERLDSNGHQRLLPRLSTAISGMDMPNVQRSIEARAVSAGLSPRLAAANGPRPLWKSVREAEQARRGALPWQNR